MKYTALLLLGIATPAMVPASTPSLSAGYCSLLERVMTDTGRQSPPGNARLELAQRVALGQGIEIKAELEARLGLKPGQLRGLSFQEPEARVCALRKIGEAGTIEAIDFLSKLNQADFVSDKTQQIWPAAQIALLDARLRMITDDQLKVASLEKALNEPHDAVSNSAINHWAVDELCNRGSLISMPAIRNSIRKRMNGQRDEDEIAFCEARIQVLQRSPDRIKALGSVLSLANGVEDTRLKLWAIYQLDALHGAQADAELDRFTIEIGKLPAQSPTRLRLSSVEGVIQDIQNTRRGRAK